MNVIHNVVQHIREKNFNRIFSYDQNLLFLEYKYKFYVDDSSYVFKLCHEEWLIILQKVSDTLTNESRQVTNPMFAKYRANKLLVCEIININTYEIIDSYINIVHFIPDYNEVFEEINATLEYKKGQIIVPDSYDLDLNKVCTNGIHYFKTILAAYYFRFPSCLCEYCENKKWLSFDAKGGLINCNNNNNIDMNLILKENSNNTFITWTKNGNMNSKIIFENKLVNKIILWHDNIKIFELVKISKLYFNCTEWFRNGYIKSKGRCDIEGFKTNQWIYYFKNGNKKCEGNYRFSEHINIWTFYENRYDSYQIDYGLIKKKLKRD